MPDSPTALQLATSDELWRELRSRHKAVFILRLDETRDGDGESLSPGWSGGFHTALGMVRWWLWAQEHASHTEQSRREHGESQE